MINSFKDIKTIYCINLKKRTDRKEECVKLFKSLDINNFEFIEAKDGISMFPNKHRKDAARMGCLLSHIDAIQNFRETKNKYALILEDDFICEHNMITEFNKYISQVPEEFCILYLGINHRLTPISYSNNLVKCKKGFTTHAYIINSLYVDKILGGKYMDCPVIDVYYANFIQKEYPCYSFQPKLVWQRSGYSDIENKNLFYKSLK